MASVVPRRTVGPNTQQTHTHTHTHAVIRTVSECSFTFHLLLPPPQANAIYGLLFSSNAVLSMALAHLSTFIPFFLDYNSLFFFFLWMCVLCSHACVFIGISLTFFFSFTVTHFLSFYVLLLLFFFFGKGTPVLVIKTPNQQQSFFLCVW